jgi:hypothetical protein
LVSVVLAAVLFAGCGSDTTPDVAGDEPPPAAAYEAGERLPEGQPRSVTVGTHCGVRWLGTLINGVTWISDEATLVGDWMPDEWAASIADDEELITLVVELSPGGQTLTGTAGQRSVVYRPASEDDQPLECY